MGLIRRFGREFDDVYVVKSLFCSLVLPTLEYSNVVWMPFYDNSRNRMKGIQKQFLLFCLRSLGWRDRFHLPPYLHRLNLLNMLTISSRQEMACCMFVFDVLSGKNKSEFSRHFRIRSTSYPLRHR